MNIKFVCLLDIYVYISKLYYVIVLIFLFYINSFGLEFIWWNDSKDRYWCRYVYC